MALARNAARARSVSPRVAPGRARQGSENPAVSHARASPRSSPPDRAGCSRQTFPPPLVLGNNPPPEAARRPSKQESARFSIRLPARVWRESAVRRRDGGPGSSRGMRHTPVCAVASLPGGPPQSWASIRLKPSSPSEHSGYSGIGSTRRSCRPLCPASRADPRQGNDAGGASRIVVVPENSPPLESRAGT